MSIFSTTPFLFIFSGFILMVYALFWYFVAGQQLRTAALMGPEQGKAMRKEAQKTTIRITLVLLIVLAVYLCAYTLYWEMLTSGLDLQAFSVGTE